MSCAIAILYTLFLCNYIVCSAELPVSAGCPSDTYQCRDGDCISDDWRCDTELDCSEGEDEEDCPRSE